MFYRNELYYCYELTIYITEVLIHVKHMNLTSSFWAHSFRWSVFEKFAKRNFAKEIFEKFPSFMILILCTNKSKLPSSHPMCPPIDRLGGGGAGVALFSGLSVARYKSIGLLLWAVKNRTNISQNQLEVEGNFF